MELDDLFLLNIIELIISITCIILSEISLDVTSYEMLVYGTLVTFTVICFVALIANILNLELNKDINGMFSTIGCVLFITSGCIIIFEWYDGFLDTKNTRGSALAEGALMIINGIIFLIDTIFIFKK